MKNKFKRFIQVNYKIVTFPLFFISLLLFVVMGMYFNINAVLNNNCLMPVYNPNNLSVFVDNTTHFLFNNKSEVNDFYMTDIFYLGTKNYHYFYSLGDILLYFSIFLLVYYTIINLLNTFIIKRL